MKKILMASILLAATSVQAADLQDIVGSCTTFALEKASISAVCTAKNGGKYKTALRLRGVNNRNGVLSFEEDTSIPSVFYQTCKNMSIDSKARLAGTCKDDNGDYVWTFIDLRETLKNYNGTLVYPMD